MPTLSRSILLAVLAAACSPVLLADTIGAPAIAPFAIPPSADTLGFQAVSNTFTASVGNPAFYEMDGSFNVGNSGATSGDFSSTFLNNVTIDGITRAIAFTFDDLVAPGNDTLTIDGTDPVDYGSFTLTFFGTQANGDAGSSNPVSLLAEIDATGVAVTPEPSSLLLLSTGVLTLATAARRRLTR